MTLAAGGFGGAHVARRRGSAIFAHRVEGRPARVARDAAFVAHPSHVGAHVAANECAATPNGRYVGVPIRDGNSVDIVDTILKKVVKVLPVKAPHNCFNTGNNNDMYVSSMGSN